MKIKDLLQLARPIKVENGLLMTAGGFFLGFYFSSDSLVNGLLAIACVLLNSWLMRNYPNAKPLSGWYTVGEIEDND
jgi:4-hydroxybenzoate polyprenyltransferase